MVGTTFGRYTIESELGMGGMGVVYRARDNRLGRLVAIKVLGARMKSDRAAWGWLLREAQIASALHHASICTIYDVAEEEGRPFIAMEYIEGQLLSNLLTPSGLSAKLVREYGILIADALGHAHERGVIHRDIKGTNIVVTPEGGLKILDFGLAKRLRGDSLERIVSSRSSLAELGGLVGTLPYLAPELLRGERANVRSDIWSFGILLYEMATGRVPFWGKTPFELATRIMTAEPPPLPKKVPLTIANTVTRCLGKDPVTRYQCARDVAEAMGMKYSSHYAGQASSQETSANSLAVTVGAA